MTPDEISEGLEFDQQLKEILYQPDGVTPKPTGLIDLVQFVAKETRYTRKTVDSQRLELAKLLDEHKKRIVAGLPCNNGEPCDLSDEKQSSGFLKIIPQDALIKILFSTIGVGGALILVFGLILLKKYGIL